MTPLLEDVVLCFQPHPDPESEAAFLNWSLNRAVWPEVGHRLAQARATHAYDEADAAKHWLEDVLGVQVRDYPTQSLILPR